MVPLIIKMFHELYKPSPNNRRAPYKYYYPEEPSSTSYTFQAFVKLLQSISYSYQIGDAMLSKAFPNVLALKSGEGWSLIAISDPVLSRSAGLAPCQFEFQETGKELTMEEFRTILLNIHLILDGVNRQNRVLFISQLEVISNEEASEPVSDFLRLTITPKRKANLNLSASLLEIRVKINRALPQQCFNTVLYIGHTNRVICRSCLTVKRENFEDTGICNACSSNAIRCQICKKWLYRKSDQIQVKLSNETIILCSACSDYVYVHCNMCNQMYIPEERVRQAIQKGERSALYSNHHMKLCNECRKKVQIEKCSRCQRELVTNETGIKIGRNYHCGYCIPNNLYYKKHEYSYKPTPVFISNIPSFDFSNTLFIGFELEVEFKLNYSFPSSLMSNTYEAKLIRYLHSIKIKNPATGKLFTPYYGKYDASISGVEIVSHPFQPILDVMEEKLKVPSLLTTVKKLGFRVTERCGLHFHMNKSYFNFRNELLLLVLIYRDIWDKLVYISGRSKPQINAYAKRYPRYPRLNHYDTFSKQDLYGLITFAEDHHSAVSLRSSTIEFRLFNATLDWNTFLFYVDLVTLLAKWSKQTKATIHDNLERDFVKFLKRECPSMTIIFGRNIDRIASKLKRE